MITSMSMLCLVFLPTVGFTSSTKVFQIKYILRENAKNETPPTTPPSSIIVELESTGCPLCLVVPTKLLVLTWSCTVTVHGEEELEVKHVVFCSTGNPGSEMTLYRLYSGYFW